MLRRLTHNWQLKLLALGIALVMWIFVVGQDKAELTVEVPVEITGIPADAVVADDVVNKVFARISGPGTLVRRAASERMVKRVNLAGMGLGEHVFQVVPEDLSLPAGVSVIRVSPARFIVSLAAKVSRRVPVSLKLKGKPAPGYEVGEITLSPPKVNVSGKKEEIEIVDWIFTEPIDVSGLEANATMQARLNRPAGRSLQVAPMSVEAEIKVRPKRGATNSAKEKTGEASAGSPEKQGP